MTGDFFDRLDRELQAAARRQSPATRRWARRPRLALVLAGLLVVAVPASAAVTGVFTPYEEPDGLVRVTAKTVIATGTSPEFGRWEAFVSRADVGACSGVRYIDPPGREPGGTTSEGCGPAHRWPVASTGGGDGPPRRALYGFTAPGAERVRIEHGGREVRWFPAHHHPAAPGAFFFASLPVEHADGLRVVVFAGDGRVIETIRGVR
jgi:hypothetical protein